MSGSGLRFACVCASNVNRSMAAHQVLMNNNFNVSSYGTSQCISMPGPNGPKLFDFGTTYSEIISNMKEEEESQDRKFYTELGLITMLERDLSIKEKPEKFSSTFETKSRNYFDVIFTYEKRIMEGVILEFHKHGSATYDLCHVINIETPDNNQNALVSAYTTLEIAKKIKSTKEDLTQVIDKMMENFVEEKHYPISYHVVTY